MSGARRFFSCWEALAEGEELKYWHIDWEAYYLAGGTRSKRHRFKDYIRWEELEISPLPWQREWSEDRRRTWVRVNVREMEEGFASERRKEGRPARGVPALYALDPRDRPGKPREQNGPIPRVLGSDPELNRPETFSPQRGVLRAIFSLLSAAPGVCWQAKYRVGFRR
ncbi:MAG: hypothetical protein R6V85_15090 [Polyangia bacterium]